MRVVGPHAVSNPRQPQAAVDENGTIYVAFAAEESVYASHSTDGSGPVVVLWEVENQGERGIQAAVVDDGNGG